MDNLTSKSSDFARSLLLLQHLEEKKARRAVRSSMVEWARLCGYEPAAHHRLLCEVLEEAATKPNAKFMINMPPGSAKSTYGSKLFPPYFLAKRSGGTILACSHNKDLIVGFGRYSRNLIESHQTRLGFGLQSDSRAADDWYTTNGGHYFCAGVLAGIAGHRADLGLIDDYFGSLEQADSEGTREKVWQWYWSDFVPRLTPGAAQVIIATRWHEKDLCGLLLEKERHLWNVISLPFIAKDRDLLGRSPGQRLWAEYFDDEMERRARVLPRIFLAQYQQEPTAEQGDYFTVADLKGYELTELPKELRVYIGSDHAISKREEADKTAMVAVGVDSRGVIWVLPYPFVGFEHGRLDSKEQIGKMFWMTKECQRKYGSMAWWIAEKEKITQCLGPFLFDKMRETGDFFLVEQVTPKKDKRTRATTLQVLAKTGQIRFPHFAPWWPSALRELLGFDNLGEDDFVDALAHVVRKIGSLTGAEPAFVEPEMPQPLRSDCLSIPCKEILGRALRQKREREIALLDN